TSALPISEQIHRNRKWCLKRCRISSHHQVKSQLLTTVFNERCADQSASVCSHKVDNLRRHRLRSTNEVTFVFAVFIINHDNHLAIPDIFNGLLNRIQFYITHFCINSSASVVLYFRFYLGITIPSTEASSFSASLSCC